MTMRYIKTFENHVLNNNELRKMYLDNGFTQEDLNIIDELNPEYFNNFEFYDNDTIILYRNITVLKSEQKEFEKTLGGGFIGEYWSLNDNTRAIWGDRGDGLDNQRVEYQCVGHLKIIDIDWKFTLYSFNNGENEFVDECEIRGKNGGESIKIIKCYLD